MDNVITKSGQSNNITKYLEVNIISLSAVMAAKTKGWNKNEYPALTTRHSYYNGDFRNRSCRLQMKLQTKQIFLPSVAGSI
jgi:hypothetical protein